MKSPFLKSPPVLRLSMWIALAAFMAACGAGKFQVKDGQSVEVRPPATSDPATAEDLRILEADQSGDTVVAPVLETEQQRQAFLQDLNEETRTTSDEELAIDAETQFEKHQEQKQDDDMKREIDRELQRSKDHQEERNRGQKPVTQEAKPTESKTTAPKNIQPTNAEPQKQTIPAKPVEQPKAVEPAKPKAPSVSVQNEFCQKLNVVSGSGKADLSHMYNDRTGLATAMPADDLDAAKIQERKNSFVCTLLPIAVRMNEEVFRQRLEVLRLQAKQIKKLPLSKDDETWLANMKSAYGLDAKSTTADLLKRVDIIPLPLLLAQAAIESGWGTSGATRNLNNIFGMHASKGQPCKTGYDTHNACMREFKDLGEGVSAYIRLLNTGSYYGKFRDARAKARTDGQVLDSLKLIATLGSYNETPTEYIKMVRQIMAGSNKLTQFEFQEDKVKQ